MRGADHHTFGAQSRASSGRAGSAPLPKCLFARPGLVLPITWVAPASPEKEPLLVELLYQGHCIVPERQRPLGCGRGVFFWEVPATLTPGILEIRVTTVSGQLVAQQTRLVVCQATPAPTPARIRRPRVTVRQRLVRQARRWGIRSLRWLRRQHARRQAEWSACGAWRTQATRWGVRALAHTMVFAGISVLLYPGMLALYAAQAQGDLQAVYQGAPRVPRQAPTPLVTSPGDAPWPLAQLAAYWDCPTVPAPPEPAGEPAPAPAPARGPALSAWPARLRIPGVGIDLIVQDGVSAQTLSQGPGHDPQTAVPGMGSNCVLAAHRNLSGPSFRPLIRCRRGERIILDTRQGRWHYRITDIKTIHERDRSILCPSRDERLTLFTCTGARSRHRLVVVASAVAPASAASEAVKGDRPCP
jgi:sortase A